MSTPRPRTLMTVHAHPDDEIIGTGGSMATAIADGHRVVLVTCTRGELGEIVIPEMDTPDNHRRLGELRAAELERALTLLGVTEWENLGYRDSGMMGDPGNRDPRSFWQADLDEAIGRLVWFVRQHRPDVITTYNDFGGYGHPDHIRTHLVAVGAFARAGDAAWYPGQLAPEHGGSGAAAADGGLAPWAPAKLYEQAFPQSLRLAMNERLAALGVRSFWLPPEDATPEQLAQHEQFLARALVPDETITTRVDVAPYLDRKWQGIHEHATQISAQSPFMIFGLEGWREAWSAEAFVLRESRVPSAQPETDLFAGLD
jgi:LmbE family N-acetylglucosaminyl deacetylase